MSDGEIIIASLSSLFFLLVGYWVGKAGFTQESRRKRKWTAAMQVAWMRSLVQQDLQYMAHEPKVKAVCERHLHMLRDDWEKQAITFVDDFRREIGCDPHVVIYDNELNQRRVQKAIHDTCIACAKAVTNCPRQDIQGELINVNDAQSACKSIVCMEIISGMGGSYECPRLYLVSAYC